MRWRRPTRRTIHPPQLLFSIPTISAGMPPTDGGVVPADAVLLHEDDWRQTELVSRRHREVIEANFAEIAAIRRASDGYGYSRVHARDEPQDPLADAALTARQLAKAMSLAQARVASVAVRRPSPCAGPIRDAVAYVGATTTVYALSRGGQLVTVGLKLGGSSDAVLTAVWQLADEFELSLVEWLVPRATPPVAG